MIVVTGGLGFIGNELVRQLLRSNQEVVIMDNYNRVAPRLEDLKEVPVVNVDVVDYPAILSWFRSHRVETVFHLAAIHYIPECNENPERTLRINVEGTQSVVRASAESGVKKVVFASSGAVYADAADQLDESSPVAPVDVYGWSKLFGEHVCAFNHQLSGIPVVIARLFNNYGPRETNPHIIPEIINQLRKGDSLKLGNVSTIRDYIHTRETAETLIRLSRLSSGGVTTVNVATGSGYTVRDVIELISKITGRSIDVFTEPARFRKFDKQVQVANIDRLKKLTGWRPELSFEEGIRGLLRFERMVE